MRERARGGESLDDLLPECFAITREAGRRTMGMRHFDVQLIGGMVLHSGAIAEMRTGEGRTLTGTLAVVLNAIAGNGVHVITVNDYLARRDAEWMTPDLRLPRPHRRHPAEPCSPTRRRWPPTPPTSPTAPTRSSASTTCATTWPGSLEEKVQDGQRINEEGKAVATHAFAIVDEVDNILIDEARTPLIISGAPEQAADLYEQFAKLAPQMKAGKTPEGMDPKTKKEFVGGLRLRVRGEAQDGLGHRAGRRQGRGASWASTTSTGPRTASWSTTSSSR